MEINPLDIPEEVQKWVLDYQTRISNDHVLAGTVLDPTIPRMVKRGAKLLLELVPGYMPTNIESFGLEAAKKKLRQVKIAANLFDSCAVIYRAYVEVVDPMPDSNLRNVFKHSMLSFVIARLCACRGDSKTEGYDDAVIMLKRDSEEFRSAWDRIEKFRDQVLVHIDATRGAKNPKKSSRYSDKIEETISMEIIDCEERPGIDVFLFTDKDAEEGRADTFLGDIYITDELVDAVHTILKPRCGSLRDVNHRMEWMWQREIIRCQSKREKTDD